MNCLSVPLVIKPTCFNMLFLHDACLMMVALQASDSPQVGQWRITTLHEIFSMACTQVVRAIHWRKQSPSIYH